MNDDVRIKRYQDRPGYRLADVAEVGLPIYTLNAQALTLAHKRLPPVEEFILRSLALEIRAPEEVSAYLGLRPEVLIPAFANLSQTENIALTAPQGMESWKLTQKGRVTLQTSEVVQPEERTLPIHFDAILRKPTLYRFQNILRHKDLREEGLIEIEIFPPKQPQLIEVSSGEIERLLRAVPGMTDQRRDVLAIRSLENVKKGFIRAIALLFKGSRGDDGQLTFVIDGTLSTAHEFAFAQTEGFKRLIRRLGEDQSERSVAIEAKEAFAIPQAIERSVEELDKSAKKTEVEIAEHTEALRVAESDDEKAILLRRLQEAEMSLEKLRAEAKQLPVRNLYVLDHAPLLQDAMLGTKRRLLIISPWITAKVVNREFVRRLDELLSKQIEVYIGYGISEEETQDLYPNDKAARDDLRQLARKYTNFHLVRLGNTHAKVLIKDSEFAAVTSFNWLSFKGDPHRTFRDEQGILLQEESLVDQKFNELVDRFDKDANAPS